jgi:hypothetical protein
MQLKGEDGVIDLAAGKQGQPLGFAVVKSRRQTLAPSPPIFRLGASTSDLGDASRNCTGHGRQKGSNERPVSPVCKATA